MLNQSMDKPQTERMQKRVEHGGQVVVFTHVPRPSDRPPEDPKLQGLRLRH